MTAEQELGTLNEFNDHLQSIVDYLEPLVENRVKIMVHGGRFTEADLKKAAIHAPAIMVSLLAFKQLSSCTRPVKNSLSNELSGVDNAGRTTTYELQVALSVVAKDVVAISREKVANSIVRFLAAAIPQQTFSSPGASGAGGVTGRNLFNAKLDETSAVNIWGCVFKQDVQLTESTYGAATSPTGLLWSEAPDIGEDNVGHYKPLENSIE